MGSLSLPSKVHLVSSITPHDVSVLIIVYFHCFDDFAIPPKVLITLITPSIPSSEINPILKKSLPRHASHRPVMPLLAPLVEYLMDQNARNVALRLLSFLQSMESLDVFNQLLKTLKENCLIKNYRSQPISARPQIRRITKTSFVGIYLERCLTKYEIGDFKDREALWDCLSQYLIDFKRASAWVSLESEMEPYVFEFMQHADSKENDNDMIFFLRGLTGNIYSNNASCLMIDHTYFQSLLNWQIYNTCQNDSPIDSSILEILKMLSLNDLTHFPAVHIICYLVAVRDNCYQDALDSLHNYFDYMLTQHEESCFHFSLLCLATFHMCLHDCPAAIKAFEEATKIARENKDTETLNLIMIWVVDFIEVYPEYANQFHVTVDQIVRYLKSCTDNENALVFENAYKFESLLLMMDNSSSVLYLESAFKYIVIALQRLQSGSNIVPAFNHMANLWDYLGFSSLSDVYRSTFVESSDTVDKEIENAFNALEDENFDAVSQTLLKIRSPRLNNEQAKNFKLLEIKFYIAMKDYKTAMVKINERIKEFGSSIRDAKWRFLFETQRCNIFLSSDFLAIRSVPLIKNMLNMSDASENSFHVAQALILLCQVLQKVGRFTEYRELLISNLSGILQFPQLEGRVLALIDSTPI